MDNTLEKGKWNVGDANPKDPSLVWTETKPGKFDWRKRKDTPTPAPQPAVKETPKEESHEHGAPTPAPKPAPKAKVPYDAPKAKVQYSNKPEVEYEVPETWKTTDKHNKLVEHSRANYRQMFADTTKWDDTKLLHILNNPANNPNIRQLLWEEAAARGIPESKINVSGTLQNAWDDAKERYDLTHSQEEDEEEDFTGATYNSAIGDFDVDAFLAQFPNGDEDWANPKDPRVQAAFHKFRTLQDRRQYDAFIDIVKRSDPYYEGVDDQIRALNVQFMNFLESSGDSSAMFVSTGGAGAGKTTSLKKVVKALGMTWYDPQTMSPEDGDYDIVQMFHDVDNEKQFAEVLDRYNGKIIVFDDKDKLLVTQANQLNSMLKNIADSDPSQRQYNIDKQTKLFKGKLIFITNKSLDTLNNDEDHKAIMSRADKNDIHFTVNENLEVLKKRYKTMGGRLKGFTPQEEADWRQRVYDVIVNNVDKIDPDKFTVRKFSEMLRQVAAIKNAADKSKQNAEFEDLFGGSSNWRRSILKMLNKAQDIDIEKAYVGKVVENLTPSAIVRLRKMYEDDKETFLELFGEKVYKFIQEQEQNRSEEEVKKAIIDDINTSSMTLEQAENIIFAK